MHVRDGLETALGVLSRQQQPGADVFAMCDELAAVAADLVRVRAGG